MQALFKTTKKKTAAVAVAIAWNSVVVATTVFCNIEHTRDRWV